MQTLINGLNALMNYKLTTFLTLLVVFLTVIWIWLHHPFNYWKRRNIPFINPVPIFGNIKDMITLQKSPCKQIDEFYWHPIAHDKNAIGFYIFNRPTLLLRDVELIKSVLIKDFNKFSNRFSASDPHSDPLGADNLFFVKNPKWKQIRVKLTPVFTSGKMRQMFPLIEEIGRQLDAYLCDLTQTSLDKSVVKEVKDINTLFSTDVISTVAYGIQANSLKNSDGEIRKNGKRIFNFTVRRAFEIYTLFFLPNLVKFFRFKLFSSETTHFLRDLLNHVLEERIKSGKTRNDLIDLLVNFRREAEADKEKKHFILEGDSLIAQAAIFFSAGFETSSSTISFSLYELARHPEIQQQLREEIRDVLQQNNGILTYETLNEMKFLNHVVQEVLRLYPVMPFLDRECTLSSENETHSLKPYLDFAIPHGMPVYIPVYSLQRDPKYFPEPNQFNPDRFSSEAIHENNMSAYMPFGIGPHNCIGERFGILQTKVGLISFLRNHRVTCSETTLPEMKFNPRALILQPDGDLNLNIVYDPLF